MNGLLLAALLSLQTADLTTTCIGFSRGGYRELNPLVPEHCGLAVAQVAALDAGLIYVTQKKVKTPWKRALIYGALAGVMVFPVVHNVRELRR